MFGLRLSQVCSPRMWLEAPALEGQLERRPHWAHTAGSARGVQGGVGALTAHWLKRLFKGSYQFITLTGQKLANTFEFSKCAVISYCEIQEVNLSLFSCVEC